MKHLTSAWLVLLYLSFPLIGQTAGATGQSSYPVFDVHLHALNPDFLTSAATANFGAHRKTFGTMVSDPALLLKKTIEYMDTNNVRQGLLSGDNQLVQRWVKAYPDRFIPSFDVNYAHTNHRTAAKQFEKEVEQGKWRALGELGLPYEGRPLNDPALFPYYAVCERKGIPVFFHTGLDGPDPQRLVSPKFKVELGDPLLLQSVVTRFPKLKVVIMHMGWPYFDHALYMLYAHSNVYLDTAVADWILGRSVFERMLKEAVDTVGSDRILFGSDQMVWPQMITPAVQSITKATYLSEQDKQRILWKNAADLLNLNHQQQATKVNLTTR
jgi:predicted TIM-barrel fold metal-dependent hydrolase